MIWDQRTLVRATHKPTGTTLEARIEKRNSIVKLKPFLLNCLRSFVGRPAPTKIIRKYELAGPAGSFIHDLRTGVRIAGEQQVNAVLDGDLENLLVVGDSAEAGSR